MNSVPRATSWRSGECSSSDSDGKSAGRTFAYRSSCFRMPSRPCSGRTLPTPHLGPPTAPSRIACASLHAARVAGGSGSPVASIAAPPKSYACSSSLHEDDFSETRWSTREACSTTSGPIPSPGRTAILYVLGAMVSLEDGRSPADRRPRPVGQISDRACAAIGLARLPGSSAGQLRTCVCGSLGCGAA